MWVAFCLSVLASLSLTPPAVSIYSTPPSCTYRYTRAIAQQQFRIIPGSWGGVGGGVEPVGCVTPFFRALTAKQPDF